MNRHEHPTDAAVRRLPLDSDEQVRLLSDRDAKQALFQEITAMPTEAPAPERDRTRIPKRRLVTVAATAALTVLTGTIAIASGAFNTENTPGVPVREMGNFTEVVEPYRSDFVFAPHRSFDEAVAAIDANSADDSAQMAEDGMTDMVGIAATCSWLDYWRTATLNGNDGAAAEAIEHINAARNWPRALVNAEFFSTQLSRYDAAMRAGDVTFVTWNRPFDRIPVTHHDPRRRASRIAS